MQVKKVLKQIVIGGLIVVTYGSFFSHFDRNLINYFSQKKPYTYAIDYEAYNKKEKLGVNVDDKHLEDMLIDNGISWDAYSMLVWANKTYSNTMGYTPYYGNIYDSKDLKGMLEKGDNHLNYFVVTSFQKMDNMILRVKGDEKYYEQLGLKDPLTYIAKRIARKTTDNIESVIIELEAPDNGDYEAHNKRINAIKEINPKFRVATSLDIKEGYNKETGIWNPEESKKYWENSDIIILQDYFSTPENLEKSIKKFKDVAKNKKVMVRVVTGTDRIKERQFKTLDEEIEEYEQLMRITKKYADGCIANDSNGIWFYPTYPSDEGERFERTKFLYKQFRGIKIK